MTMILNLRHAFHIVFYLSALMIALVCLLYTLFTHRTRRLQNRFFLAILVIIIANTVAEIGASVTESMLLSGIDTGLWIEIFQFLYFVAHTALAAFLLYYVCSVNGMITRFTKVQLTILTLPLIITELLVLSNPFTHCVYYYDSEFVFHRNWAEGLIYISAAFYTVLSLVFLFRYWNAITKRRRVALFFTFLLFLTGLLIQLINIDIKSELLGEAIGILALMLIVENEDDRIDADTNTYNRKALHLDITNYLMTRRRFHVIAVNILNSDIIQRVTGSANSDILTRIVASYFQTLVPPYQIYHTNHATFVLTVMGSSEKAIKIAKTIEERFEESWSCRDISVTLNAVLLCADVPEDLSTDEEIFLLVDSPVPEAQAGKILRGKALDYLMRRADVEKALHRGMAEHHFEVFYQPTYYLEGTRLHGAEALLRLKDPDLGFIPPDEFIPVAERIGLIDEIGDFVLHEVCAFLKSGIPEEKGMECINVNLSMIQCMQREFVLHILSLVDSYGIDHSLLNFEITESVASKDYKTLSGVIKELRNSGFRFSMDDYGTGYSNMQSLFELDFDVVKIDKSILWGAEKDGPGLAILENSVRMIHQIGKKILVEGVETAEQVELLRPLNVEYLQGYYFSRPVPKNALLALLDK